MLIDRRLGEEEVQTRDWDVVVVGAGPAGLLAAHQLTGFGLSTLLVDRKRFPRSKVCGGCVNERSLSLLREAGVDDLIDAAGAIPLSQMEIHSPRQKVALSLPGGVAISRSRFDDELLQRVVARGATFISPATARLGELTDSGEKRVVELQLPDRSAVTVQARLVVLADGLANSSLRNYPGAKSRSSTETRVGLGGVVVDEASAFEAGCIYMAVSNRGYVGLTRFADGQLNIAAALNAEALKQARQTSELIAQIVAGANLPEIEQLGDVDWSGTIGLTRKPPATTLPRVLYCGDAAGYVEPFTGEGIANALQGGYLAASHIANRIDTWNTDAEREWGRLLRSEVQDRYRYCRWISRLSRHPRAVDWALSTVKRFPALTRPIIKHLNEPLDPVRLPG